jgi:hypothetical protein
MSWVDELKFWRFKSSKPQALAEIRERYEAFVLNHGELFENKIEELTRDDLEDFKHRKRKFKRIWLIVCGVLGLVTIAYIIDADYSFEATNSLFWLIIAVVGGGFMMMRQYNRTLDTKEKQVIQGVVTAKIIVTKGKEDDHGCYFEISLKEKIQVLPRQYVMCEVGDIVRIEVFSKDVLIKRKVFIRGKI